MIQEKALTVRKENNIFVEQRKSSKEETQMEPIEPIRLNLEELESLHKRITTGKYTKEDIAIAGKILRFMMWFPTALMKGQVTRRRLRYLMGIDY